VLINSIELNGLFVVVLEFAPCISVMKKRLVHIVLWAGICHHLCVFVLIIFPLHLLLSWI